MDFNEFSGWVTKGMLGGAAVYAISVLSGLKNSVDNLAEKLATVIEKTSWHERTIAKHDDRIDRVEKFCGSCPYKLERGE